ncbi:DUF72 domain-containing protein [Verrucomicrobiota bacterium]
MQPLADNIACGIAGWSYPDWDGYVYTPDIKDKLRFMAGYVDAIEINSTFYRPPSPRTAESWVRRTGELPDFFFAAKLSQEVTHGGRIDPGPAQDFCVGLKPLVEAGRLRHLLAQFRYDYADRPDSRDHLRRIRDRFGDLANLTLELRHNSWQSPGALEFLGSLGVSVANLDYPLAGNSFNMEVSGVGDHAYFRLHGRNAKAWFDRRSGRDETYNYRYSEKEVEDIVRRAVRIAKMSKTLTLVANNHYQGKEAVNAIQIKARISGRKVPVPPKLLERYPELVKISAGAGEGTSTQPELWSPA